MVNELNRLLPTRQSLLSRLKDHEDQESWRDFFETYWRLIYEVALKAGLTESEAEEVVQETVIGVSRKIGEFKTDPARGSFKAWLMHLTRWRIMDQFRKRSSEQRWQRTAPGVNSRAAAIDCMPEPAQASMEAVWHAEWENSLVQTALDRVRTRVSPRQLQIFDLHVQQGIDVQRVSQMLEVSTTQIYLAKHRVGRILRREITWLRSRPEWQG